MAADTQILARLIDSPLLPPPASTMQESVHLPGYRFAEHTYEDEVEIVLVLHGACYVGINNQFIRIKKNECLIIFPRVTHNYFLKENESCRILDLVFKPGDLSRLDGLDLQPGMRFLYELAHPKRDYLRFLDNDEVRSTLEQIFARANHPEAHAEMLLRLAYCALYVQLSRVLSETDDELSRPKTRHVAHALGYMLEFYARPDLTVEEIARQVGLSSRHLSRLFLQELGLNVQEYLTILKIKKAKDLLRSSEMDITRIAYELGFNSSQYFITTFKKIEHVTPGAYRSLVRGGLAN